MAEARAIILLGPTAVGKTEISLLLAERLRTEIVCADSMQVYRGMDIGTAKPTLQEQCRIRHHMFDVCDPENNFSVAMYIDMALPLLRSMLGLGLTPLVVGGTGLYIRALTRGLVNAPASNPDLLERLEKEVVKLGKEHMHKRLRRVDPAIARAINPEDSRRVVRALAVHMEHGAPLSRLQARETIAPEIVFSKIGLIRKRGELHERINHRVDEMIRLGLVEETEALLKGNLSRSARQALGYKEIAEHLSGETSLEEAVEKIKNRTRRFCKRQLTWFRKETDIHWIDISGSVDSSEVLDSIMNHLAIYQ